MLVRDTRFFPADTAAEPPPEFAPSIVQGKGYDLADARWSTCFSRLLHRVLGTDIDLDLEQPWRLDGPVYGDPRLTPQRLGQQAFQAVVRGAYDRRCAVTGDKIRPTLQAAHTGQTIALPERRADRPGKQFLEWYLDTVFRASWAGTRDGRGQESSAGGRDQAGAMGGDIRPWSRGGQERSAATVATNPSSLSTASTWSTSIGGFLRLVAIFCTREKTT